MKAGIYENQVTLMLKVLPIVARESCFALKGGTAINFFIRDLPRLSVDIDLVYLPINDRKTALSKISDGLENISKQIQKQIPGTKVTPHRVGGQILKLTVISDSTTVVVEPNGILRGTIYPCETRSLTKSAVDKFNTDVKLSILSVAEIYGGKLCAAFDRGHPRDLFDLHILFQNEGITESIRDAFVIYLASHDRPMSELLAPEKKDIRDVFENQFQGMTASPISLANLYFAREEAIRETIGRLTERHRKFLISIKRGEPEWELMQLPGIEYLPGIQWKLINIKKMSKEKHEGALERLEKVLKV